MTGFTDSGYDVLAGRPKAASWEGRIVPTGIIGRVVPSATQAVAAEGVP